MQKAKHLKDILRLCFGKITLKVVWKVKEVINVLQRTLPLSINSLFKEVYMLVDKIREAENF